MALQFIVGRAGSGKTSYCIQEIRTLLEEEPHGSPLIYIVPEQMTFQTEYELVSSGKLSGMIRAQVFSFTRLAWKVLQEAGGLARQHISRVGIHMLLRKIIESKRETLQVFQGASQQSGFIDLLEETVKEYKQYCISPEQLTGLYHQLQAQTAHAGKNEVLLAKLHDLQLIYAELEQYLQRHYLAAEDYLQLLAEKIGEVEYLHEATIWVDGFHSFTPQELQVLQALLQHASKVFITLTLDGNQLHPDGELKRDPHYLDLFYPTLKTYQKLREKAFSLGIEVEKPIFLPKDIEGDLPRFRGQPMLAHLERTFPQRPQEPYSPKEPEREGIHLYAAVHARAEVEAVAQEVINLVRDQGYRYRELAIMVRNIEEYYDLLQTIFTDYDIPLFLDQKRSMLFHPLVEFIRSSLDVITGGWRYDAVFRCVKTDLLCPEDSDLHQWREEMDKLENYCLAYGIQGRRWTDGEPWRFRSYRHLEEEQAESREELELQKQINRWREEISTPLITLQHELNQARNTTEMCTALFNYLELVAVPRKIETWRDQAEEAGRLEEAREHDQVWSAVLELFDQMVEILGEEEVSIQLFAKLVESGLESMRFALVPPALDQVVVATLGRSRLSSAIKCVFLLGVNEGVIPAKPEVDGVLTEEERVVLEEGGLELAPSGLSQLTEEPFMIYNALASAKEYLWISYPLADREGKALEPSTIIHRIKEIFPTVQEELLLAEPEIGTDDGEKELRFVNHPGVALAQATKQLNYWKSGQAISPLWWDTYSWFREQDEWQEISATRLQSLFYQNREHSLNRETSRLLYGQHVQVSVSRMERFQSCPFAQFISHGLRLKERPIFRLEAPDIGQLFHAALNLMAEHLWQEKRHWAELSEAECRTLAAQMVEQLAPRVQSEILFSSNRHHYIMRKLKQVVERASIVLSRQAQRSGFSPIGLELAFGGKNAPLPSLRFRLENGCTLELIGRIDRVDQAESSQGLLLRVIDYKSSQTNLSMAEVYYGLALQMLTYLDVIITNAEYLVGREAIPAGVLYFHVHNPLISTNKTLDKDELETEIFKRFKMKGLLLADVEAVQMMDTELTKNHSPIVPVGLKADGTFYANSAVATREELDAFRNYVRHMIREIATDLTDGLIAISPYKLQKKVACTFCSYRSICQFDPTLEENEYRLLPSAKKEVFIAKMVERGGLKLESF